ncbi:Co2+/Mg2+ efflux protein ApaG [Cobetia crustatorum]|uniref:Co2+/Mg2+ efflux protein ApaG n=1 Tax=Cobetia crustatorum TaxID=553385 RepID=A0A558HH35_9GAMM|nr:Co2+/Mg2+ efflux protein ApaG [Cobetia crustatorum]TVU68439.1 Co2+/Mg2+ efflux protein ApaG [Cobetia crustatorum]
MSDVTAIRVDTVPEYCADDSRPEENRFVFRYTITVHNGTGETVQLLARYWKITQGSGNEQEVRGKGVIGKQPLIAPGESFSYTSHAVLDMPVGVMQGAYTFCDATHTRTFDIAIAPFRLAGPHQVH